MSELLTVEEVARALHLHKMTVRRHIGEGRLKAVRVGRRIRIRSEDLESFIEPAGSYSPERAKTAILKSAGSWSDLDADALLEDIYRRRGASSRPLVRL